MIVDSSALIAILHEEHDADRFTAALLRAPSRPGISAANWLESAMVAERKGERESGEDFDALLARARIDVIAVTPETAREARLAWRAYGRGNHPAALNFGDCFAYALAKERGQPLLFKGDDFAKTDITPVLPPATEGRG